MPTNTTSRITPPEDPREFEKMVREAVKIRFQSSDFQLHGRPGQKQDGVDIYAMGSMQSSGIGIQCKNTVKELNQRLIKDEIAQAIAFHPPLKKLYIATTLPADIKLQRVVRNLSDENTKKGYFHVAILFWEDIQNDLAKCPDTLRQFYPDFQNPYQGNTEQTLNKIASLLPYDNGLIYTLRDRPFPSKTLTEDLSKQLDRFLMEMSNPACMFLDNRLEILRQSLIEKLNGYSRLVGYHYTRVPNTGFFEFHCYDDDDYRNSAYEKFRLLALEISSVYSELFKPQT